MSIGDKNTILSYQKSDTFVSKSDTFVSFGDNKLGAYGYGYQGGSEAGDLAISWLQP